MGQEDHEAGVDEMAGVVNVFHHTPQAGQDQGKSRFANASRDELIPTEAELARHKRRAYEAASELLERSRAMQASKAPAKPNRRKTIKARRHS